MKKIIAMIMVVALMAVMLVGCGNMSVGMGNFNFKKIHVDMHNYSGCLEIAKWYDNENGIEVKTKDGCSMYLAEGMYVLIEDKCPFCGE